MFSLSVDYLVFGVAWLITFWTFRTLARTFRQPEMGRAEASVFFTWGFSFCLALYLTFILEDVQRFVALVSGIGYLARLLAYMSIVCAIYCLLLNLCLILEMPIARWSWLFPGSTTLLLLILFPFSYGRVPLLGGHAFPQTTAELLFRTTLYLYVFTVCLWLLPAIWRQLRQERVPATQIRLAVMAIGLGAATLLAAGKFTTHFLAYRGEHSVLIDLWNDVATWALLVAVLCWASILFFPGRVYGWLAQPLIYLGKYRILQDLRAVETRLHLVATPVVPTPYPWTQRILNTDFHIYLVMLHLLDGQQVLQATLQQSQDDDEKLPQIGALQQVEYWEADLSARAKQLYQLFQEYSTTDDYELLIERYRQLGRRLRKEWILE